VSAPAEIADRRATVRRLRQGGASHRQIAAQLHISKDTVARDLEAPVETMAQRLAHRVAHTDQVVSQACAAAQAVIDARPAYTLADEDTARRWCGALRAAADQLAAQAAAFADYYAPPQEPVPGARKEG